MKVWITEKALASGIFEVEAEIVTRSNGDYAKCKRGRDYIFTAEWTKTRAEAVVVAKAMRDKKVAALREQIKRYEAATFDEVTTGPWAPSPAKSGSK